MLLILSIKLTLFGFQIKKLIFLGLCYQLVSNFGNMPTKADSASNFLLYSLKRHYLASYKQGTTIFEIQFTHLLDTYKTQTKCNTSDILNVPFLQKILSNYILVSFFLEILRSYNIYVKRVAPIIKAGHESSFEHEKIKKQICARNTSDATSRSC